MISEPYERGQIRVQGIVDCTSMGAIPPNTFVSYGDDDCLTLGSSSSNQLLTIAEGTTALHIDVDKEGVIPMVVKEQGYEWVPVYTRKLT